MYLSSHYDSDDDSMTGENLDVEENKGSHFRYYFLVHWTREHALMCIFASFFRQHLKREKFVCSQKKRVWIIFSNNQYPIHGFPSVWYYIILVLVHLKKQHLSCHLFDIYGHLKFHSKTSFFFKDWINYSIIFWQIISLWLVWFVWFGWNNVNLRNFT